MKEMAAQSFVFVVAGFETTSVTLGFCMYELALNPHIQDKLIKELDSVNSELTYEILNQLPYMEMVVNGKTSSAYYLLIFSIIVYSFLLRADF